MIKKTFFYLLILMLGVNLAGCTAGMRKKFIRKKKQTVEVEPIYRTEEYERESNSILYTKHYSLWKANQEELIELLDEEQKISHKRKRQIIFGKRCIEELKEMRRLIDSSKVEELDKFMEELAAIVEDIEARENRDRRVSLLRMNLLRHKREMEKRFSVRKMEEFIK